ncbi:hypothetical protein IJE86_05005 [bacterium]|nr:hypothetical protein [bacterium]
MKKKIIYALVAICIGAGTWGAFEASNSYAQQTQTKVQQTTTQQTKAPQTQVQSCIEVTPLEIVANPHEYLNKNIKMNATFDKFSTLGLDYQPALKKSEDYIGILIRRDDITDHVMPLPEMKLFLKRKTAEKYIDLESGDKIAIEGTVFSTAMSDPWIEITKLTVVSSKKPIKEN